MNYTAKRAKNLPSQTCDAKTMNYTKKLAKMQKLKGKMKKTMNYVEKSQVTNMQ